MNKVSEYSDRIISRLKLDLENEIILSIYDMLKDEDSFKLDLSINSAQRLTYVNIDNEENEDIPNVEITEEYLDSDGLYYSNYRSLNELDLNELYCLWEYIKGLA